MIRPLVIGVILVIVASCDRSGSVESDCPFIIDTVAIVDTATIEKTNYYLVLRISGWHEKTEIVELYDRRPEFDRCARSLIAPIVSDSLELDRAVAHLYFDRQARSLEINYNHGAAAAKSRSNLAIEFK